MKYTHIHTLRQMPPFSQSAYTNSKPKITMLVQHFGLQGRRFTNFHYYYYYSRVPDVLGETVPDVGTEV